MPGTGSASINLSGIVTGTGAGTVTVKYSYTPLVCTGTATTSLTINPLPIDPAGTISGTTPACNSTTLGYSAPSPSVYWETTTNGTSTANRTDISPTYSIASSGTYYARSYDGTCWSSGTKAFPVKIDTTITISADYPASATVFTTTPNPATFTITGGISGGTPSSYLWEYSDDGGTTWSSATGGVYTNGTTNTLSISNSTGLTGTLYRCIVNNSCGNFTSVEASLTVNTPSYIWTNPITGLIRPGSYLHYRSNSGRQSNISIIEQGVVLPVMQVMIAIMPIVGTQLH